MSSESTASHSTESPPAPSQHDSNTPSHTYIHPTLNTPVCHINFFQECPKYAYAYKSCMAKWYDNTPEITMATQCMREWVALERCMALQVRYGALDVLLDEDFVTQLDDEKDVKEIMDAQMRRDPYVQTSGKFFRMKYGYDMLDSSEV